MIRQKTTGHIPTKTCLALCFNLLRKLPYQFDDFRDEDIIEIDNKVTVHRKIVTKDIFLVLS